MVVAVAGEYRLGPAWMGRLAHGSDIHESLEAFCREKSIQTAWIQFLGALREVTLAYYDQAEHKYYQRTFVGEYEIVSGTGNITLRDGQPMAHIHMVISDPDYASYAGHVMPGTCQVFACEFTVLTYEGAAPLVRGLDTQTGLTLWQCREGL